jgi:hypothetical protein
MALNRALQNFHNVSNKLTHNTELKTQQDVVEHNNHLVMHNSSLREMVQALVQLTAIEHQVFQTAIIVNSIMVCTSLTKIFDMGTWLYGTPQYQKLMQHHNKDWATMDDENISFHKIAELTDLEYAIDCTASRKDLSILWRKYSIWCASLIENHITESECKDAITAARKFVLGEIDEKELKTKYDLAYHARLNPKYEPTRIQDSANSCAVASANLDIEQCIQDSFLACGFGLIEETITLDELNKLQLAKFLEITS